MPADRQGFKRQITGHIQNLHNEIFTAICHFSIISFQKHQSHPKMSLSMHDTKFFPHTIFNSIENGGNILNIDIFIVDNLINIS